MSLPAVKAMPSAEWPARGGVSEATTFGWDKEHTPWWDQLDVASFAEKCKRMTCEQQREIYSEMSAYLVTLEKWKNENVASLNRRQRVARQTAVEYTAAKRRVLGQLMNRTDESRTNVGKRIMLDEIRKAKSLAKRDLAAGFQMLVEALEEFYR